MTKHILWDMIFDSRRSSISGWFLIPKTNSWRYNYKSSFLPSVMTVFMRILIEFDRVHELECACVWVVDGWIIMNLLNLIRLCELICLDNVFVWLIDTVISLWGWIKYYFILSYWLIHALYINFKRNMFSKYSCGSWSERVCDSCCVCVLCNNASHWYKRIMLSFAIMRRKKKKNIYIYEWVPLWQYNHVSHTFIGINPLTDKSAS